MRHPASPLLPAPDSHATHHPPTQALGPAALPACAAVLLAHALSAYDPDADAAPAAPDTPADRPLSAPASASAGLILLSRSSQRKASRALRTSQPEEFFHLALDTVLARSAEAQVRRALPRTYPVPTGIV